MNATVQFDGLKHAAFPARSLHLAIGMFDGVHRGHRTVIQAAVESAHRTGGIASVLTFWPHPSTLFRPENPTRLIQDSSTKIRVLETLGVDAVIVEPFTPEFAAIAAEEFLPWLKERLPGLAAIYVGENFRFGRGRRGDASLLMQMAGALRLSVFSLPRVMLDGEPISSTRIRQLIEAGNIEQVNALLGYHYFSQGAVTAGKRLGRSIGFPTLNLTWSPAVRPKLGVYAVRVSGPKSAPLDGVANYGLRPTVEQSQEPRLEVHILGECPYGEGDSINVEWLHFIRPEKKFPGVEELRVQIALDRETAAKYLAKRG